MEGACKVCSPFGVLGAGGKDSTFGDGGEGFDVLRPSFGFFKASRTHSFPYEM